MRSSTSASRRTRRGGADALETIAVAALRLGHASLAWSCYESISDDAAAPAKTKGRATNRLNALRGQVATIDVASRPEGAVLEIRGVAAGTSPLAAPLRAFPGKVELAAVFPGGERVARTVAAKAGAALRVELVGTESVPAAAVVPVVAPAPPTQAPSPPTEPPAAQSQALDDPFSAPPEPPGTAWEAGWGWTYGLEVVGRGLLGPQRSLETSIACEAGGARTETRATVSVQDAGGGGGLGASVGARYLGEAAVGGDFLGLHASLGVDAAALGVRHTAAQSSIVRG